MNLNGKEIIKQLVAGGMSREEIKAELIKIGYEEWEVESELNFYPTLKDNSKSPQSMDPSGHPELYFNKGREVSLISKKSIQSNKIYFIIFFLLLFAGGLVYYSFSEMYFDDSLNESKNKSILETVKSEIIDSISIGTRPLLSKEELEHLEERCFQSFTKYKEKIPSGSPFSEPDYLRSERASLKEATLECYANYSIMADDYSLCADIPSTEIAFYDLEEEDCYLAISSLNGDEEICEKLAKIDKEKYNNQLSYGNSCYTKIAQYHSDVTYCDKIPSTTVVKQTCILNLVNENNYDKLCMSLLPCTNCRVSTPTAANYASCFAQIAQDTQKYSICDEALGFDDLCYSILGAAEQKKELCNKGGRFKQDCLSALSPPS